MVVQVSFLKCDTLSQLRDCYNYVLLSQLKLSSFKVNQLHSPEKKSVTSQTILRKSLITLLGHFFNLSHLDLWTRRVVKFQNVSCRQKLLHKWKVLHKQPRLVL